MIGHFTNLYMGVMKELQIFVFVEMPNFYPIKTKITGRSSYQIFHTFCKMEVQYFHTPLEKCQRIYQSFN
jgi:hypothetical protein